MLAAAKLHQRVPTSPIRSYGDLDSAGRDEHAKWRVRAIDRAEEALNKPVSRRLMQAEVDDLADDLLRLSSMLAEVYRTPDLGNKPDPVDELIYIILARRTRELAYQPAYLALKARYATWEELAAASTEEIEEVVRFSGLGRRKAQSLKLALGALLDRFGECTLEPTRGWDDGATYEFLCTLPEVGPKSAACVMMCSLDRPAFPVDAHVGRVLERLGLFRRVGIELAGRDHKIKQQMLWDAVPPALRYPLHVNILVHGRAVCVPGSPRCGDCVISQHCDFAREGLPSDKTRSSRTGK